MSDVRHFQFIVGTRSTHLTDDNGARVCNVKLYKKDLAMVCTVFTPETIGSYLTYSNDDAICNVCADYARGIIAEALRDV